MIFEVFGRVLKIFERFARGKIGEIWSEHNYLIDNSIEHKLELESHTHRSRMGICLDGWKEDTRFDDPKTIIGCISCQKLT